MSGPLKYGRLAARRPVGLKDLTAYLADPLPEAPPACAAPTVADWQMLGNDQYGDCTWAGFVHERMATAAEHAETEVWPTDQQVIDGYLAYTGGQDSGCVEADLLQAWQTTGLLGNKLAGYAPVDHRNPDELRSVVATFGGCYLGIAVPEPMQTQFASGEPLALTGTPADRQIEGGHCIIVAGYDAQYAYVVTWGRLVPATWDWLAAYLEEAWCLLTTEDATANGVDLAALQADLAKLEA